MFSGHSSTVLHILKNHLITDYLERKGHFPVKSRGGRISYLCPFPDHKETKPSFIVWTNSEYQNFRCFGCSRCYNIIHLVAGLENLSYRDALKSLSEGMEISLDDDIETQLEIIDREYTARQSYNRDLAISLSSIASQCRLYLKSVNQDGQETRIIDRLYAEIDNEILKCDFDAIEETATYLPSILSLRQTRFYQKTYDATNKDRTTSCMRV